MCGSLFYIIVYFRRGVCHILVNYNRILRNSQKRLADVVIDFGKWRDTGFGFTSLHGLRDTSGTGNTVIAVGGDGTLHDVLNGFEDFESNCLGLIPFGTGNDFASAAGIPTVFFNAFEIFFACFF